MQINKKLIYLLLLSLSLLFGCKPVQIGDKANEIISSSNEIGPSQDELYAEVKNNIATQFKNGIKGSMIGEFLAGFNGVDEYEINQIEKINCKKSKESEKIYDCDVFIRFYIGTRDRSGQPGVQNPPLKVSKTIQKITNYKFYKSQTGWVSSYE
jgi:hypothetical protein